MAGTSLKSSPLNANLQTRSAAWILAMRDRSMHTTEGRFQGYSSGKCGPNMGLKMFPRSDDRSSGKSSRKCDNAAEFLGRCASSHSASARSMASIWSDAAEFFPFVKIGLRSLSPAISFRVAACRFSLMSSKDQCSFRVPCCLELF